MHGPRSKSVVALGSLALLLVVALTVLHACFVANGLVAPEKAVVEEIDAAPRDPCAHARIPAQPLPQSANVQDAAVFALSAVEFGGGRAGGASEVGYDLDNICSCFQDDAGNPPVAESCTPRARTTQHCDGVGGRDNALAETVNQIPTGPVGFGTYITRILREGRGGLLMVLDGYNGEPNDDKVSLGFLPSHGKYRVVDGGPDADAQPEYVDADTTNRWSIAPDSYLLRNNSGTPARLARGWVRDGTLVVLLPSTGLPLVGLQLSMEDAYLVAPLNLDDKTKPLIDRGTIVGRWGLKNLIESAGRFTVSLTAQGPAQLCTQGSFFDPTFKNAICQTADINLFADADGKGKPCDAVSIAIGFRTENAEVGDFVDVPTVAECPDGSVELTCPQ